MFVAISQNNKIVIMSIFNKIIPFLLLTFFLMPVCVSAAPGDFGLGRTVKVATGTNFYKEKSSVSDTIGAVISVMLAVAGTIFLVLTVYGGITWMTAMGNSEKVEKAKSIITAAIIGGAITASAYVITFFVMSRLTAVPADYSGDTSLGNCVFTAPDTNKEETNSMTQAECAEVNGSWSSK